MQRSHYFKICRLILFTGLFLQCVLTNQDSVDIPQPAATMVQQEYFYAKTDPRTAYYATPASVDSNLRCAIQENDTETIQMYLLQRRVFLYTYQQGLVNTYPDIANPYKDYGQGNTGLHVALQLKRWDAAYALLEHAVDNQERRMNITNHQGETPLHIAARTGEVERIIELLQILLKYGISLADTQFVNLKCLDKKEQTFLDWLNTNQQKIMIDFINNHSFPITDNKLVQTSPIDTINEQTTFEQPGQLVTSKSQSTAIQGISFVYERTPAPPHSKLYQAIEQKNATLVKSYLELRKEKLLVGSSIADPYRDYGQGNTAFHLAAKNNDEKSAYYLVKYAVDDTERNLTIKNERGETPIHLAAKKGHTQVIYQFFVGLLGNCIHLDDKTYIDLAAKDNQGKTALQWAIEKGHHEVAQLLQYPFHFAIKSFFSDDPWMSTDRTLYDCLTESGYAEKCIHIVDDEGNTPLHIAAFYNHLEAINYLLKLPSIPIDAPNQEGFSALHLAAMKSHQTIALALVKQGAQVATHRQPCSTQSALKRKNMSDSTHHQHASMDLIDANLAQAHQQDEDGNTALHKAIKMHQESAVKDLIKAGIDLSIKNKKGQTALDLARTLPCSAVIQDLLQKASTYKRVKTEN